MRDRKREEKIVDRTEPIDIDEKWMLTTVTDGYVLSISESDMALRMSGLIICSFLRFVIRCM